MGYFMLDFFQVEFIVIIDEQIWCKMLAKELSQSNPIRLLFQLKLICWADRCLVLDTQRAFDKKNCLVSANNSFASINKWPSKWKVEIIIVTSRVDQTILMRASSKVCDHFGVISFREINLHTHALFCSSNQLQTKNYRKHESCRIPSMSVRTIGPYSVIRSSKDDDSTILIHFTNENNWQKLIMIDWELIWTADLRCRMQLQHHWITIIAVPNIKLNLFNRHLFFSRRAIFPTPSSFRISFKSCAKVSANFRRKFLIRSNPGIEKSKIFKDKFSANVPESGSSQTSSAVTSTKSRSRLSSWRPPSTSPSRRFSGPSSRWERFQKFFRNLSGLGRLIEA